MRLVFIETKEQELTIEEVAGRMRGNRFMNANSILLQKNMQM